MAKQHANEFGVLNCPKGKKGEEMVITKELFIAYLNCQTKAYLTGSAASLTQSSFGIWRSIWENNLRRRGMDFLREQTPCKTAENPSEAELSIKGSTLYFNYSIETGEMRSLIDAVEKIELRGAKIQWIPHVYQLDKRAARYEKLLLAYDAFCLQTLTGAPVHVGRLIDGVRKRARKIQLDSLLKTVQQHTRQLSELLRQETEPQLILNKHCVECEFRTRCREKAVETDDLSPLSKMSIKTRQKLQRKGIFTVRQLSYTFRPRRGRKRVGSKSDMFSHPLRALAIRENKIHVAGTPNFTVQDNDCFLDVEGIPDHKFYYLAGIRFQVNGQSVHRQFWAGNRCDEEYMWRDLVAELRLCGSVRVVHFGNFEREFLTTMNKRHSKSREQSKYVDCLIQQSFNCLSVIYGRVYFPTYSNSLKDIAHYLGYTWPDEIQNGYEALLARYYWEASGDPKIKDALLSYNACDCEALQLVARCISNVSGQILNPVLNEQFNLVDTNKLKGMGLFKFGQLDCVIPDFAYINRASYWDYQRDRIIVRSRRLRERIIIRGPKKRRKCRANKMIVQRRICACPHCKSREIYKWGLKTKSVYDLKFSPAGVKRWVVKYHFNRYKCLECKKTFMPPSKLWTRSKYGNALLNYVVFLTVDLQLSQRAATKLINQFFGLDLTGESLGRFKRTAAAFCERTYRQILRTLVTSSLVHVDETKVSLNGQSAYVWVLANHENVAYFCSESREGDKVQAILKRFTGVLVSDFYALYDSFKCRQQKCLIHLMRDLNDDLLREPFNEELKLVVNRFGSLLKPIVETIDRYGLKRHFIRRHKRSVGQFYRWLTKINFATDVGVGYKKRFEKNENKLFTFLDYDDVPWNNNAAEHAIKAFATLRRVFGGSSSERGIKDYLILLSVCQTCRYRGINPNPTIIQR